MPQSQNNSKLDSNGVDGSKNSEIKIKNNILNEDISKNITKDYDS